MKVSAKSDYAIRAAVEIAAAGSARVRAEDLATATNIPRQFLENILGELRRAGIVRAQRGTDGGYLLARPASDIDLAMVLHAVGSSLADGDAPERDEEMAVDTVWRALHATTYRLLARVSLADLVRGELPEEIRLLALAEREREPN